MSPKINLVLSDEIASRVDEIDTENFNCIMKMHPYFPKLISAFEEEPAAYDTFIGRVRSFFPRIFINYMCIYSLVPLFF
jgi:hypothetical protein